MKVELLRANIGDAKELHAMQIKAFKELRTAKSGSDSYC